MSHIQGSEIFVGHELCGTFSATRNLQVKLAHHFDILVKKENAILESICVHAFRKQWEPTNTQSTFDSVNFVKH